VKVLGNDRLDFFDLQWLQEFVHSTDLRHIGIIFTIKRAGRRTLKGLLLLFNELLFRSSFHESFALLFSHHPALLHSDIEAPLHSTVLTTLPIRQRKNAASLVSAFVGEIMVILNGSAEKGFAGITGEPTKVKAFRDIPANSAVFYGPLFETS